MRPRLFVSGLAQETNAFSPLPAGLASFTGRFNVGGVAFDSVPPFPESLLDGARLRASGGLIELIEGPMVGASPGGLVTRVAYETLRTDILRALQAAGPVDMVALHLHGAMMADGTLDCEGDLLTRIRAVTGPDAVIGAMLDPHAHVSPAMVEASDLLIAYKEYPHTDFRERAEEVIELLLAAQAGHMRPTTSLWDTGTIGVFHTNRPSVRQFVDRLHQIEADPNILSVSLIHGFPWGDTPDLGTRMLVVSDGDAAHADTMAEGLAGEARALTLQTQVETVALDRALDDAMRVHANRPVVLADGADNTGGGAAGDSTFVLAALIEHGISDACIGPIWDPLAVSIAFEAGAGARLKLRVGGKAGPFSGMPVDGDAEVLALDEAATQSFAGAPFPMGRAASVRMHGIDLVLTTERNQARGVDMFERLGIAASSKRIIVVKSSQHFYDGFAPIAERVVYLDCPGTLQSDLAIYPYQHVARPRWPIDKEAGPIRRVTVTAPRARKDIRR